MASIIEPLPDARRIIVAIDGVDGSRFRHRKSQSAILGAVNIANEESHARTRLPRSGFTWRNLVSICTALTPKAVLCCVNSFGAARFWSFSASAALPDRHESLCECALLGAGVDQVRSASADEPVRWTGSSGQTQEARRWRAVAAHLRLSLRAEPRGPPRGALPRGLPRAISAMRRL